MEDLKIIHQNSPYYPSSFLSLNPIPEFLFAVGNVSLLNSYSVAIVGARACQKESRFVTEQFVNELTQKGITIISGMADGIDSVAHEICLQNDGNTIAIIGSGFNIAKRRKIFDHILHHNGLILSEYFPDIPAYKYHFPRRNQLLVSLSKKVVAIEVHLESGTMITAKEALLQKTPLYTFPGSIMDSHYAGNNWLLTQGAICITSPNDFANHLDGKIQLTKKKNASSKCVPPKFQTIYSLLSAAPQDINTLSKLSGLPLKEVQSQLFLMELDNFVQKLPNNFYMKSI